MADRRRALLLGALLVADLGWGGALIAATPPFSGIDEVWHWMRAEHVSRGYMLPRRLGANDWGGPVDGHAEAFAMAAVPPILTGQPVAMADLRAVAAAARASGPEVAVASFANTASYPPLAYLPGAAGIAAARAAGGDLAAQWRGGRIAGLLAYVALIGVIAWLLPAGGLLAAALLGGPTALYLATSYSADPLNIALPALVAAACLRLRFDPTTRFGVWRRTGLALLCVMLGLLKVTSVVFAPLVLLIPAEYFGSRRGWAAYVSACVVAAVCMGGGWAAAVPFIPGLHFHRAVDPPRAIGRLLSDPGGFLALAARVTRQLAWPLWRDSYARFGGAGGPYHFIVGGPWCAVGLLLMVGLALTGGGVRRGGVAGAWLSTLAAVNVAAILAAFRIVFTPPEMDWIDGLQGRYFVVPTLLALLGLALWAGRARWRAEAALVAGVLAAQAAVMTAALRHFAPLLR